METEREREREIKRINSDAYLLYTPRILITIYMSKIAFISSPHLDADKKQESYWSIVCLVNRMLIGISSSWEA